MHCAQCSRRPARASAAPPSFVPRPAAQLAVTRVSHLPPPLVQSLVDEMPARAAAALLAGAAVTVGVVTASLVAWPHAGGVFHRVADAVTECVGSAAAVAPAVPDRRSSLSLSAQSAPAATRPSGLCRRYSRAVSRYCALVDAPRALLRLRRLRTRPPLQGECAHRSTQPRGPILTLFTPCHSPFLSQPQPGTWLGARARRWPRGPPRSCASSSPAWPTCRRGRWRPRSSVSAPGYARAGRTAVAPRATVRGRPVPRCGMMVGSSA